MPGAIPQGPRAFCILNPAFLAPCFKTGCLNMGCPVHHLLNAFTRGEVQGGI